LPPNFHPILVDRIVTFIYTADYEMVPLGEGTQLKQKHFSFYNASFIPADNPPSPEVTALVNVRHYTFDLHMYALAEELDYPALKSAAYAKLLQIFMTTRKMPRTMLKDFIDVTFAPPGSAARICKDEDGALQNLAVATIIAHDYDWVGQEQYRKEFLHITQGTEYAVFWSAYHAAKEQNQDILKTREVRKETFEKRAKRKEGGAVSKGSPMKTSGINKKDRYPQKAKAKIVRADEDGDVEME